MAIDCPATLRLNTDGRFFLICDSNEEYPWDNFSLDAIKQNSGYVLSHNAIMISTFVQLSDVRVDFTTGSSESNKSADDQYEIEIETESLCISIYGGPTTALEPIHMNVVNETTICRIERFNRGIEGDRTFELLDDEFLSHMEWERYNVNILQT